MARSGCLRRHVTHSSSLLERRAGYHLALLLSASRNLLSNTATRVRPWIPTSSTKLGHGTFPRQMFHNRRALLKPKRRINRFASRLSLTSSLPNKHSPRPRIDGNMALSPVPHLHKYLLPAQRKRELSWRPRLAHTTNGSVTDFPHV